MTQSAFLQTHPPTEKGTALQGKNLLPSEKGFALQGKNVLPSEKGSALQGKNMLPSEKGVCSTRKEFAFFPCRVDPFVDLAKQTSFQKVDKTILIELPPLKVSFPLM